MQESTARTDIDEESTEKVASPETLSVWGLAWPSILANVLFASVGVVALKAVGNLGTDAVAAVGTCLLYTSPSPRDRSLSRMPSSA